MAVVLTSLGDVALQVRHELGSGGKADAFRIVCDWYSRARRSTPEELERAISEAPVETNDPAWDAMLAGLTEQVCLSRALRCPRWAFAPGRFLATWWFLTPYVSLHPSAFVEAPSALANRGVFIHAADLESV